MCQEVSSVRHLSKIHLQKKGGWKDVNNNKNYLNEISWGRIQIDP